MRRGLVLTVVLSAVGWAFGPAKSALAADLCVGDTQPECFSTIQDALDAAQDGDTIRIGPGTFAGGIVITKSISLVGVSAAATRIEGGGPVVTIGDVLALPPTVSIRDVTITGGLNTSVPARFAAFGGGVRINFGAGSTTGANVSISRSVITGNRANPAETLTECGAPQDLCAVALGGGIYNNGTLTVTDTLITGNVAGSTATDPSLAGYAAGGGIYNFPQRSLTLVRSVVSDNRAAVDAPNGFNTDAGGIASLGLLTVEDSAIKDNTSAVAGAQPAVLFVDTMNANAGGLWLTSGSSTTIRRSQISGNTVTASNTGGDAQALAGGIDSDGSLLISDSTVDHNTVTASVPADSGFATAASSGGLESGGHEAADTTTVRNSHVANNTISATSITGTVLVFGGGLVNTTSLTLEHTVVTANAAAATGATGGSAGAGIANIHVGAPLPKLTVADSVVAANRLSASPGVTMLGAGLFTLDVMFQPIPVTLTRTVIHGNKPDQCAGC